MRVNVNLCTPPRPPPYLHIQEQILYYLTYMPGDDYNLVFTQMLKAGTSQWHVSVYPA